MPGSKRQRRSEAFQPEASGGPPVALDAMLRKVQSQLEYLERKATFLSDAPGDVTIPLAAMMAVRGLAERRIEAIGAGIAHAAAEDNAARAEAWRKAMIEAQGRSHGGTALPRGIEATPGVCGGDARIAGTRIPVWSLVAARNLGATDRELLDEYPALSRNDLDDAWSYAATHAEEIDRLIHENEVA